MLQRADEAMYDLKGLGSTPINRPRALERLHPKPVLTQAGEAPQESSWHANVYDLLERRFPLRHPPPLA